MSRQSRRRRSQAPATAPADATTGGSSAASSAEAPAPQPVGPESLPEWGEVRRLLHRGETRLAVERAKEAHKRHGSPASEALLVDAYVARIAELRSRGLAADARALDASVRERFPATAAHLDVPRRDAPAPAAAGAAKGVAAGARIPGRRPADPDPLALAKLLRPLADPGLSPELRAPIERTITCEIVDLAALARCEALPDDHPLRRAAAGLAVAFDAVTTGPVDDAALALPEVSHRSPLAPWKALVRAIAAFYRRDDETCARHLELLPPDAAAVRLLPALRALLRDVGPETPAPATTALVAHVRGGVATAREALRAADQAFASGNKRKLLLAAVARAVRACAEACPDVLDPLRQQVAVRCAMRDIPYGSVHAAVGGPSLKDAAFWRLFARAQENAGDRIGACAHWEEFRRHALHQRWFAERGPEAAGLDLHMIELLRRVPPDHLREAREALAGNFDGFQGDYEGQPESVRAVARRPNGPADTSFLDPDRLYARACAADPAPETFRAWLEWVREPDGYGRRADDVAEAWARALPDDARPLVHLMESAEDRDALKKALGYLERAERLDGFAPEVRRARRRLLFAAAMRHLRAGKASLTFKDIAQLEALPAAQEGDFPAVLAAVRGLLALSDDCLEAALAERDRAAQWLGSRPAADALLCGLAAAWRIADLPIADAVGQAMPASDDSLLRACARACRACAEAGRRIGLPAGWDGPLRDALAAGAPSLDAPLLATLAESALHSRQLRLAYASAGAGLDRGGPFTARFLFLRVRSLPDWDWQRRDDGWEAALALARRQRDLALADEIVRLREREDGDSVPGDEVLSPECVEAVLAAEKAARDYPRVSIENPPRPRSCACPACRAARAGGGPVDESGFEDLDDLEEDIAEQFPPSARLPGVPPGLGALMPELLGEFLATGGKMPDLEDLRRRNPALFRKLEAVLGPRLAEDEFRGPPPSRRRRR